MSPDSLTICLRAQMSSFYSRDDEINCHLCNTCFYFCFYFLTQGLNLGVLHLKQILYHLSHKGSPTPLFFLCSFISQAILWLTLGSGQSYWQCALVVPVLVPLMLSIDFEEGKQVKTFLSSAFHSQKTDSRLVIFKTLQVYLRCV